MTAFLKIDSCQTCHRDLPWEYVPAILVSGRPLAGTGVWRSQLADGACLECITARQRRRREIADRSAERERLIQVLGGEKPYREFTFGRFLRTVHNEAAYNAALHFNPASENLYFWGPCGVGKTHIARATARRCIEESLSVIVVPAFQISRRVRMKDPDKEQAAIDELAGADVLVIDDLGTGSDTAFAQQILQEILDTRDFARRAGLVVVSRFSLNQLAQKMNDDTIPSRLAGMCRIERVGGADQRLAGKDEGKKK